MNGLEAASFAHVEQPTVVGATTASQSPGAATDLLVGSFTAALADATSPRNATPTIDLVTAAVVAAPSELDAPPPPGPSTLPAASLATPPEPCLPRVATPSDELGLLLRRDEAAAALEDPLPRPDAARPEDSDLSREDDAKAPSDPAPAALPVVVPTAPEALLLGAAPLPPPTLSIDTSREDLKGPTDEALRSATTSAERPTREDAPSMRDDAPSTRAAAPEASGSFAVEARPSEPQPPLHLVPGPFDTAAPPPPAPAPLVELPRAHLEDPSLHVFVSAHTARVTVETADAGALSVQLRVADGVADVRAAGPAAGLLDLRQGELRVALAQQGLSLGNFDLTQSRSGHPQDRPEAPPSHRPGSPAKHGTAGTTTHTGRLSIKA